MTTQEAENLVRNIDESGIDEADIEAAFTAIFGRTPDAQDREEGLWSHCCAAVE